MKNYVYYSIIIFSTFIILLYIYLIYEKIIGMYIKNKNKYYSKEIEPYLDKILERLEEKYPEKNEIEELRHFCSNSIKRKIIKEKLLYYMESFTGSIRQRITRLCEDIGLVNYELKDLKGRDKFKIALACKTLGEYRSAKALDELVRVSGMKTMDIRYHALMALAKIGNIEAIKIALINNSNISIIDRSLIEILDNFEGDKISLYKCLIDYKDPYISSAAMKSGGNYGDYSLSNKISEYFKSFDKNQRIAAIKAIGEIGDARYTDDIIECLKDNEWEVRAIAAKSLGMLGDSKALFSLANSLNDKEWWVRYNAAWSIIKLPDNIDVIEIALKGDDKFASDIMISAIENSGLLGEIYTYEASLDFEKRRLFQIIKENITDKV